MRKKGSICSHITSAIYFETHSNSVHCELKIIPTKKFAIFANSLSNIITFDFQYMLHFNGFAFDYRFGVGNVNSEKFSFVVYVAFGVCFVIFE